MTILTPIALAVPAIGEPVEVTLSTGTVTGEVATRREMAPGLWQLTVALPGGGTEVLTVTRADDGGWYAYETRSIGRALATARHIKAGHTLHGPVNQAFHDLADALLALAGIASPVS